MAQTGKQLAATLDKLTAKVAKLKESMKGLEVGSDKHLAVSKKLNTALNQQAAALEKVNTARTKLTKNNKNHTSTIQKIESATKKATTAQKASTVQDNKKGSAMSRLTGALGTRIGTLGKYLIATKLIQLGIQALTTAFVTSTKEAIKFDGAVGDLGAVTGKSGAELENLGKIAKATAGFTKLTAVEVVGLQKELAKLGTSSEDIAALTLPLAQLSQALGESGSEVATVFKSITNQFGLTTLASVDLANTILKSTTTSALNLNSLATGFQYVGTQAALSGLTVEETSANLAILADNGLKASKAGTGFRNVLIAAVKSGQSYTEFIDQLAEKGLSAGDAIKLFGKRAAAAGLLLVQNRQAVKDLTGELNDNNAILGATIQQMGSAQGVTQQLTSAWNNLLISIGESIAQSSLFIGVLKLINKEAGRTASLYKNLKERGEEATDAFGGLIDTLDGVSDDKLEIKIDDSAIEAYQLKLLEVLEPDRYKKATERFNDQVARGLFKGDFLDFLRTGGKYGNGRNYIDLLNQLTTINKEAFSESEKLAQGQADNIAREQENIKAVLKEADSFRKDALSGNLDADKQLQFIADLGEKIKVAQGEEERFLKAYQKAQKLYDADPTNTILRDRAIRTRAAAFERQAETDILEAQRKVVADLANDELALQGGKDKALRLEVDRIKRARKEELAALKEKEALEELLVNTQQERRDFDLKFSSERSDINNKFAAELRDLAEGQDAATNIEAVRNLTQQWELLGDKAPAAIGQVSDSISGLQKDVNDYTKEQDKLLKEGVINVDERNDRVSDFAEEQKRILQLFIKELITTGKLTGEAADIIKQSVDNIEFDGEKFDANGGILATLLGINPESFVADTQEEADRLFGEELKKQLANALTKTFKELGDIYDDFQDEKFANQENALEAELDAIKRRYEIEEDILKSSLDNQLITESQYRVKVQELQRAQLAEENAINKAIFENKKKQDRQSAVAEGFENAAIATVQAFANSGGDPISGAIKAALLVASIGAGTAARVAAINTRQFFPKKFEDGGMVSGPSHSEGGVPFTVQGRGGYEMEGGEYIINKRSASMHKELLDRINNSGRTAAVQGTRKFAQGGEVIGQQGELGIEYLKVIAEGISTTNEKLDKPTRAFVSSADLRTDSRERSIRNNNDRV
jgi:hypothetical protein